MQQKVLNAITPSAYCQPTPRQLNFSTVIAPAIIMASSDHLKPWHWAKADQIL